MGFLDEEFAVGFTIDEEEEVEFFEGRLPDPKEIGGYVAYYELENWFNNTFSINEQWTILLAAGPRLIRGKIKYTTQTYAEFMEKCFRGLRDAGYPNLAQPFLKEALRAGKDDAIFLHFFYHGEIKYWYRRRNEDPEALDKTIEYCLKQIEIAPEVAKALEKEHRENEQKLKRSIEETDDDWKPGIPEYDEHKKRIEDLIQSSPFVLPLHSGYKQLTIIYDKQKRWEEAIALCDQAMEQGWDGDWEERKKRYQKKLKRR